MRTVEPDDQTLEHFRNQPSDDSPIVMINLLRYRDEADYSEGPDEEPCSGREAYRRYGALVQPMIVATGGQPIWLGTATGTYIAPTDERWDDAILVKYPSRKAFLDMLESADYGLAKRHRTAALEDSRLIETRTLMGPISE